MSHPSNPPGPACENRSRIVELAGSSDLLFVASTIGNVAYASGFRSANYGIDPSLRMAVVFDQGECILVGPTSESWAAAEAVGETLRYHGYREFFFDTRSAPPDRLPRMRAFESFETALEDAIENLSAGKKHLVSDAPFPATLRHRLKRRASADGSAIFRKARSIKTGAEIALLHRAANITERSVSVALDAVGVGTTENEIASIIGAEMMRGGMQPGFLVVASGPRSALVDVHASTRMLRAGDLLRIDVGGTLSGYWSDTACTAFLGEPDATVRSVSDALAVGQRTAIAGIVPGAGAKRIFDDTVAAVRAGGLPTYHRHHVGHGVGLDAHEFPTLGSGSAGFLMPGMVVNVETPYYRPMWGGLMYEDTLLVTETGADRFTRTEPGLIILPA